jgi:hypothetical protein
VYFVCLHYSTSRSFVCRWSSLREVSSNLLSRSKYLQQSLVNDVLIIHKDRIIGEDETRNGYLFKAETFSFFTS